MPPPQDGAPNQLADIDVSRLTRAECAAALAKLKALEGALLARLLTSDERAATSESSGDGDRLLTVSQASELLAVTKSHLYRNAKRLGLAVKLGDGTLRFSFLACQRFIARSAVAVPRTRGVRSRS
jgi:hypothetical protein